MKKGLKKILKVVTILVLLFFLYGFSSYRSNARYIGQIHVNLEESSNLLITSDAVKNLLIETIKELNIERIKTISLKDLESNLNSNKLIEKANVFMSLNGDIYAKVIQREPILRVQSDTPFYIDKYGVRMPLSEIYSPRVPMFWDWGEETKTKEVYQISKAIYNDDFLSKNVIDIWEESEGYFFKIRLYDFKVLIGSINNIEDKFMNFKAFYQRAVQENVIEKYSQINLKYKKQVVCKKK